MGAEYGRLIFDRDAQAIINAELIKQLKAGEKPVVSGFVSEIKENNYGVVYLYNNAFLWGRILAYQWRGGRTRLFEEACKTQRSYIFHVTDYSGIELKDGEEQNIFELSRLDLEKSWYEIIDENGIVLGKELTVRCVRIPDPTFRKKDCFGAVSDEIEGLEVFVSVSEENASSIKIGEYYKCEVAEINNEFCVVYATLEPEQKSNSEEWFKFPWEE